MSVNINVLVLWYFLFINSLLIYDGISVEAQNLKCSFEKDVCEWQDVSSTWRRYEYKFENRYTGPQTTNGEAEKFYIYVPGMTTNDSVTPSQLESPTVTFSSTTITCFRFWYYMYGEYVRNLTVALNSTIHFNQFGNKSDMWHCGIVNVTGFSGKITVEVYRNTKLNSVIAVDNFEIIHSSTCSQETCGNIVPTETTGSSTTGSSTSSQKPIVSTTQNDSSTVNQSGGGVIDELPVVISVPSGVLVVGCIIAGISIYRRRHSKKFEDSKTPTTDPNPYSGSPRQSGMNGLYVDDVEVYNEVDETQMVEEYNKDYLDPVSYDEIGYVTVRSNGTAGYINQKAERPESEDYLEPISVIDDGLFRHKNHDYINSQHVVTDGRPQSGVTDGRPQSDSDSDSGDYLDLE